MENKYLGKEELTEQFLSSCKQGNLEKIKELLNYSEINNSITISNGFQWACYNKKINVVKYFIFEVGIEKNSCIESHFKYFPNEQIEKMLELSELNKKLNKDLITNSNNQKKMKV